MDSNLEFWKGSCGYTAPGSVGLQGSDGNSIHFSSIDIVDSSVEIRTRIRNNQSLSNNNEAITFESYKEGDHILDTYGQLGIITKSLNVLNFSFLTNIAFPEKKQGYSVPVYTNDKAELEFELQNTLTYAPYSNLEYGEQENSYLQRNKRGLVAGYAWRLWRYRYYGNEPYGTKLNIPSGYNIVPKNDPSYILTGRNDDGDSSSFYGSKAFVEYVANNEDYCKICAVLNNGLVIESMPSEDSNFGIFIEKGYIESIDKNLTTLNQYTSFEDELDASTNDSSIKKCIKSGNPTSMCHMYFEYSHNGETYRMNIKVT